MDRWFYRNRPKIAVMAAFAIACLLGLVAASLGVQSLGHAAAPEGPPQDAGSTSRTLATPASVSTPISSSTAAATSAGSRPRSTRFEPKPPSP